MPDPANEADTGLSSSMMDENEAAQDAELPVMERIESLFMIDPPTSKVPPKITLKVQESDEEDEKSEDEDISSLF